LPRHRIQSGFTLIEMLVVVLVIGILTAILLPALTRARRHARRAACMNNLKQIGFAVHMFTPEKGKVGKYVEVPPWRYLYALHLLDPAKNPIDSADPCIARQFMFLENTPAGPAPVYNDQGIGMLFPNYLKSPDVFYCPESLVWTPQSGWPAEDLNYYVTYQSREAGAVDAQGRGWYGVMPLTFRRFERVSFISCASWRGYVGHDNGWNVWFLDNSVNFFPHVKLITTLDDYDWFQTLLSIPKKGAGRPSPWVRFDRWKDAVPEAVQR